MRTLTARIVGLLALTFVLSTGQARASAIFTLQEIGSDTIMTGSGSLDLSGFSFFGPIPIGPQIDPNDDFVVGSPGTMDTYVGSVTGPSSFGSGGLTSASSGTGDLFGLDFVGGTGLGVPVGYVSGSPLSGTGTYLGQTFSSLGVTPGTYVWTLGNGDTVSLVVANATVPEPATLTLLAAGALGVCARRRRQRA